MQAASISLIQELDAHVEDYEALFFAPLEHRRLAIFGPSVAPSVRCYIAATTRILGIQQIRPLMMAILSKFSAGEANKAARLMLSWSMRFIVVGSSGGGTIERNYGLLAQRVSKGEVTKARELRTELAAPTDRQFLTAFLSYSISNAEIARYVLRSLEAYKRREREPAITFFENPAILNLEHILPRTPTGWNVSAEVAKGYFKRVGNMTLLKILKQILR